MVKQSKKLGNMKTRKIVRSQYLLAIILFLSIILALFISWLVSSTISDSQPVTTTEIIAPAPSEPPEEPVKVEQQSLQKVIDEWVVEVGGRTSVVIADQEGNILASKDDELEYFAASIYKLYVAYAGYQQVDGGEVDRGEIYINGNTRAECLDLMIRDSDSPCGEKLWNELGKEKLTKQLKEYGILNTSMAGLTTTAKDASLILGRIERGEGLSEESRLAYLDSLKTQDALYRRGLPSGFSDRITVFNKVGWNEYKEWHDAAIIELPDGRKLIISVFSENVGFSNIIELTKRLEKIILPDT